MGFIEDERYQKFNARCLFFDRLDGTSLSPYDSLNTSFNVQDNQNSVKQNLKIIKNSVNADTLFTINQIHSDTIIEFDGKRHNADGIYTKQRGVFLGIRFADCTPIVFFDKKTKLIAAVHAGWKGSYLKIAQKTVKLFKFYGANPKDILVTIGPHICKKCYEIKSDVAQKFLNSSLNFQNGKIYLDLTQENKNQMLQEGIDDKNIYDVNICTFEDKRFFSYRRDRICGRNIGGIIKY